MLIYIRRRHTHTSLHSVRVVMAVMMIDHCCRRKSLSCATKYSGIEYLFTVKAYENNRCRLFEWFIPSVSGGMIFDEKASRRGNPGSCLHRNVILVGHKVRNL